MDSREQIRDEVRAPAPTSAGEAPAASQARRGLREVADYLRPRKFSVALVTLGAAFVALRFVGLETAPPGFFSDEFRGALHQICLGERGTSAEGVPWPSFVPGAGGGLYTPPFLYLGMIWIKLFGPTIAACRAFVALFTALTILATALIALRLAGARAAVLTFLAAALSPWSFQFARIAWDPPLAPAFLMWSVYLWLFRARLWAVAGSALCFALALYCYPATRIQAPLVFAMLGCFALYRRSLTLRQVAVFGVVTVVAAFPLIQGTLDGTLMGRGNNEAIWADHFVQGNRGRYPAARFILQAFFDNLHAHFRPTYLFFTGDANLRHATQFFGELGLLDSLMLAVIAGFALSGVARVALGRPAARPSVQRLDPRYARLSLFAVASFMCGVLPAALCWSGVPHALRAIGAWPFLSLLTGAVLAFALESRERWFKPGVLGVALLHSALFVYVYFAVYPRIPKDWFDFTMNRAMLEPNFSRSKKLKVVRDFPEGFRYYSIAYGGETCASSEKKLAEYLAKNARTRRK